MENWKGNLSWLSLVKEFLSILQNIFKGAPYRSGNKKTPFFRIFFFYAKLEPVTVVVKRDAVFLAGVHRRVSIVLQII